jgi:GNAT superfamily N-acetyltransferase
MAFGLEQRLWDIGDIVKLIKEGEANPMQISRISLPLPGLEELRAEAELQHFRFVERLISDWNSGLNTFNQPGEIFIGAHEGGHLIALGGLNKDPYAPGDDTGRIRHLYVLAKWRGRGVGRALVDCLLKAAAGRFSEIRLRTNTPEASNFYSRCGFDRIDDETASHRRKIPTIPPP